MKDEERVYVVSSIKVIPNTISFVRFILRI
jgi:hypothetical protein